MRRSLVVVLAVLSVAPIGARASVVRAAAPPPQKLILTPAGSNTLFTFEGLYPQKKGLCDFKQLKPLRAKYRGRLELILRQDGSIGVINGLTFSNYLRGLAEVPPSWPLEALKAQAIAARSYALASLRAARDVAAARGYDICSTDACQVYRGATIELGAFGERWVRAVEGTRGLVLTYGGRVVPAFYFSTSTGRTRRSFPGGTPQPWLPSVSGNDAQAPLAHWTATVTLSDLAAAMHASDDWPGGAITTVTLSGDRVTMTGSGHSVSKLRSTVENDLNSEAPCLFPDRYPSQTGSAKHGPLPQTVPSSTYTLSQKGNVVTFSGRGWGHGIGMSQFGANFMAAAGNSATQILKHFYGPASITSVKEPGEIRVLAADGLQAARVSISGPVSVTTETGSMLATGNLFQVTGGKTLTITRGVGPSAQPVLQLVANTSELNATPGDTISIPFNASRAARVSVELAGPNGIILTTTETSYVSGDNTVTFPLKDSQNKDLPPGAYTATVIAYDGLDRVRSAPVAIAVRAPNARAPGTSGPSGYWVWIGIVLAGIVVVSITTLLVRRRNQPNVNV